MRRMGWGGRGRSRRFGLLDGFLGYEKMGHVVMVLDIMGTGVGWSSMFVCIVQQ